MTENEGDDVSRGPNWVRRRLHSLFVTIEPSIPTQSFGIFVRSFKEDFPLWIGSVWILWKQQPPKSIGVSSSNSFSPALEHRGGFFCSSWKNLSLNLFVDAIILGTLLIYKKSYEETWRKQFDRRGNCNDNEENGKTYVIPSFFVAFLGISTITEPLFLIGIGPL